MLVSGRVHFLVPYEFSGLGKILTSKCKDYKTTTETFKYHWIPIGYPKIWSHHRFGVGHLGDPKGAGLKTQKLVDEAENSPSVCPQRYVFLDFIHPNVTNFAPMSMEIQEFPAGQDNSYIRLP